MAASLKVRTRKGCRRPSIPHPRCSARCGLPAHRSPVRRVLGSSGQSTRLGQLAPGPVCTRVSRNRPSMSERSSSRGAQGSSVLLLSELSQDEASDIAWSW